MKRRNGFTLVELLVSMALIIFIMAILSHAFVAALTTFQNLKAEGDMAEKLRSVTQVLQRDLAADHFDGKKRLSNPYFWVDGPPAQGYFRVWQGSPGSVEGADVDGIGSFRSVDHMLSFTVKQRGGDMGSFFSASAPAAFLAASASFGPSESRYQFATSGTYNYQWGEVTWFLQPLINPVTQLQEMTVGGIPLFTLSRHQRLLVPDNNMVHQPTADPFAYGNQGQYLANYSQCLELSCWDNPPSNPTLAQTPGQVPGTLHFNSPTDITVPTRRFGMVSYPAAPLSYQAGLLYGVPSGPLTNPAALWPFPPTNPGPTGPWFAPNAAPPNSQTTYVPALPPGYQPPLIPMYPTLTQQGAGTSLAGADIQLDNVVSFDVRLKIQGVTVPNYADPFITLLTPTNPLIAANPLTNQPLLLSYFGNTVPQIQTSDPGQAYNPAFNYYTGPMVFDTWTSLKDGYSDYSTWNVASSWNINTNQENMNFAAIPMWNGSSGPIIQALQISIRIWDSKTNQTRQVTIVQAM